MHLSKVLPADKNIDRFNLILSSVLLYILSQVIVRIMDQKRRKKGDESEEVSADYYDKVFCNPTPLEKKVARSVLSKRYFSIKTM